MYRFFFSTMGHKHYEDIKADSFRQARSVFFENHKTAFDCHIDTVWTVDEKGNLIDRIY